MHLLVLDRTFWPLPAAQVPAEPERGVGYGMLTNMQFRFELELGNLYPILEPL